MESALEMESQWDNRVLYEKKGNKIQPVGYKQWEVPIALYLGGGDGIQGVVKMPIVWNQITTVSGKRTDNGIGDLALGVKIKLLEDTGFLY